MDLVKTFKKAKRLPIRHTVKHEYYVENNGDLFIKGIGGEDKPYRINKSGSIVIHYKDSNQARLPVEDFPYGYSITGMEELEWLSSYAKIPIVDEEDELRKQLGDTFVCKQCGKCCESYSRIPIAPSDRQRWLRESRIDIISKIDPLDGDGWFNPRTGENYLRCPWRRKKDGKTFCRLQNTKPIGCKGFPYYYAQVKDVGCKGYSKC